MIYLNGERLKIEYEGLHTICHTCGTYGHLADRCPLKAPEQSPAMSTAAPGTNQCDGQSSESTPEKPNNNVGEWMTVPQRSRNWKGKDKIVQDSSLTSRNQKGKDKEKDHTSLPAKGGNRFANLADLEGNSEGTSSVAKNRVSNNDSLFKTDY